MQAVRVEDWPYMGTLSAPHTAYESKRTRKAPRIADNSVTVFHRDNPDERYTVPASFYGRRTRRSYVAGQHVYHTDAEAANKAAERQAQLDHKAMLRARVAGNEQAL